MSYDYIIIGAGSSGCALSARLINLCPDGIRIALIESGHDYLSQPSNDCFSKPERCPETWDHKKATKGYRTVPQKALNDRQILLTRAEAIGGCSVVNAMIWNRGFKEDWDRYMPAGFQGNDVEPEFEWLEERIKPVRHETNFLGEKAIEAAELLGYKKSRNSVWASPGTSNGIRITIDEQGQRQDMYRALGADDCRIALVRGMAEKIIFNHSAEGALYAAGVRLKMHDGSTQELFVQDKGEVIISCGAIDSPKLLQLSGVGPKHLMNELGIPLVLDSPVGEGLKDHTLYVMVFKATSLPDIFSPNSINATIYNESLDAQYMIFDGNSNPSFIALQLIEPYREKKPATNMVEKLKNTVMLFAMRALAFILSALANSVPSVREKIQTSFGMSVSVMKPSSVGSVMIGSTDINDAPLINSALLSDKKDMETMIKAVQNARTLLNTPPLADILGKELTPSPKDLHSEKDLIQNATTTYHHSTGTCSSSLDEKLRFKGIDGLRVVDASSLPFHPRVPTNASSMAIGARCASLIADSRKQVEISY
mmetsp:Transcript_32040/g.47327  ORF Transcript_32040/g.47327 Transcript_32040/m.47327 type:complete len:539 (+) Transcript_32040:85-1701(+)|eukprot:CAMPEP_0194217462 /NCGR_PEP_ID=MMETSP0156-20130528/21323_1 /TAXON_ID=33649 /ORGANISM="Thalassionema nitzschioides, Strain L26-B" /LENGTH=538 /DNA_ID=CAMNT_0038946513 /DNA_START=76 /DNA_END=1692 /DNA_ORIENTATION=-